MKEFLELFNSLDEHRKDHLVSYMQFLATQQQLEKVAEDFGINVEGAKDSVLKIVR